MEHPHILPFLGISQEIFEPRLSLVSPWMPNGNVLRYMEHHHDVDRLSLVSIHADSNPGTESTLPSSDHPMLTRAPVSSRTQTWTYPWKH
jgi:hypothetical protein